MSNPLLLTVGECMIEMAPTGDGTYRRGFAGDTFNTAWYARRMMPADWRVGYCSCVGADQASGAMIEFMTGAGIETDAIRRLPDRTVGLYMIDLHEGERSFSYWRGASAARMLAEDPDWLARTLAGATAVHFSGISLAVLPPDHRPVFLDALRKARAAGVTTVFDTNQRPRLWPDLATMRAALSEAAGCASVILPSFDEEEATFGDIDPAATLARYRNAGADTVIVKNGADQMTAWSADEGPATRMPPVIGDMLDSTAAGDSFDAGALSALLTGQGLDEAMRRGAELAAKVVQGRGALVDVTP